MADIEAFPSEWLEFHRQDPIAGRKTLSWHVRGKSGTHLGVLEWYAPWRQYVLKPAWPTIFNRGCLRDVADFCERVHKERV